MSHTQQPTELGQPSLGHLMAQYLQNQADAHAVGLAGVDTLGEVLPYEAGPVQPIDAKPAWDEALAVLRLLGTDKSVQSWKAPPQWPSLVASHEPAYALAMCVGNFPQLVRNLHGLLQARDLQQLRQSSAHRPTALPDLLVWADKQTQLPQALLAIACLRLAKEYDRAAALVKRHDAQVPSEWQAVWANEKAALAWHRGDVAGARALWAAQAPTVPVLFNRGMAALFDGAKAEAQTLLSQVVAQLPESSAWHHLARLYLMLAESK